MTAIHFEAKFESIGSWTILRLPKEASAKLPSRGMVMVEGTINGLQFQRELEPDGRKSHWLKLDNNMLKGAKAEVGDTIKLEIEPSKEWPNPEVPKDLKKALVIDKPIHLIWNSLTPMARWDWIRWIRSTKNAETRAKRIKVAFSKLKADIRRPCCFNRTECTIPEVSNKGILLESTQTG